MPFGSLSFNIHKEELDFNAFNLFCKIILLSYVTEILIDKFFAVGSRNAGC